MKNLTLLGAAVMAVSLLGMSTAGVGAYNTYDVNETRLVDRSRQNECLALNIYHEAKGESELGQRAVAYVTLNRAHDPAYPDDICDVVYQAVKKNGVPVKNQCQFSWYCDGKDDEPTDEESDKFYDFMCEYDYDREDDWWTDRKGGYTTSYELGDS